MDRLRLFGDGWAGRNVHTVGVVSLMISVFALDVYAEARRIPVKIKDKDPLSDISLRLLQSEAAKFSDLVIPGIMIEGGKRNTEYDVANTGAQFPALKVEGATLYSDIMSMPGCEPHDLRVAKWLDHAAAASDAAQTSDELAAGFGEKVKKEIAQKLARQRQIGMVGAMTTYEQSQDKFGVDMSPVVQAQGAPACAAAQAMTAHKGSNCPVKGGYSSHMPNSWSYDARTKCVLYQLGYVGFDEMLLPYPLAFMPPKGEIAQKGAQLDIDSTPKGWTGSDGSAFYAAGIYPLWVRDWAKRQLWGRAFDKELKKEDAWKTWGHLDENSKKNSLQKFFYEFYYLGASTKKSDFEAAPARAALFQNAEGKVGEGVLTLNSKLFAAATPHGRGVHLIKFSGQNLPEIGEKIAMVENTLTKAQCAVGKQDCLQARLFVSKDKTGEFYLVKNGDKYFWRNAYNKGSVKPDSKVTELYKIFPFRVGTARADKANPKSPVHIPLSILANTVHFGNAP